MSEKDEIISKTAKAPVEDTTVIKVPAKRPRKTTAVKKVTLTEPVTEISEMNEVCENDSVKIKETKKKQAPNGQVLLVWSTIFVVVGLILGIVTDTHAFNGSLINWLPNNVAYILWVLTFTGFPLLSVIGGTIALRAVNRSRMWGPLPKLSTSRKVWGWILAVFGMLFTLVGVLSLVPNVLNLALTGLPN